MIDVYGWLVGRGNNNTSNDCGYLGNWNLMKNVSYPPTIHPPWCIASYWFTLVDSLSLWCHQIVADISLWFRVYIYIVLDKIKVVATINPDR